MNILKPDQITPLYIQLANAIRTQIEDETLKYGDKIPSESQLMEIYNVSRITVRKSIEFLVEEGLLLKRQGKGTFVAFPEFSEQMCASPITGSFTDAFLQLNMVPTTRIISQVLQKASPTAAKRLNIEAETPIVYISRVRYINDYPAVFEEDFFTAEYDFLLKMDLEDKSLLGIIFHTMNQKPSHFHDTFQVKHANSIHAQLLEVAPSFPLLHVSQIIFQNSSKVLYYNEQFVRSDVYKYTVKST
ncbi:MAG TPA: GntR family transcriptional regulator [Ruminiclostridium sp.]|nr:GntR family transcriptional regulator [Ruminiclostridium sp.]